MSLHTINSEYPKCRFFRCNLRDRHSFQYGIGFVLGIELRKGCTANICVMNYCIFLQKGNLEESRSTIGVF